jgi:Ni/Fe-hydrogenase 1 B-type cytochrome subunit
MFGMFTLGTIVLILTGLGLYAQGYGWGSGWMNLFGWVTVLCGSPQAVRTLHHLAMWYVLVFAVVHIYMAFREDIMGGSTILSTMSNGVRMWKGEPKR